MSIALGLLLAQAANEAVKPNPPQEQKYFDCVNGRAEELEPSAEPAETIGNVAVFVCHEFLDDAARAAYQSSIDAYRARGVSPEGQDFWRDDLSKLAQQSAVARVVVIRAKKASSH
jgi:hypothetical protein